jgi:hypothetical protein
VNYTRFSKATSFDYDETLDKIIASAQKFNAKVIKQDVAKAGGGRGRRVNGEVGKSGWAGREGRQR